MASACACQARTGKSLRVKGSDTMVNLGQAWSEIYMEKNPDVFIAVTGGGSGTGIAGLISGTCDIAMSSRNIMQKELTLAQDRGRPLVEIKVALDGIAVVVHPKNPVSKLTMKELADIFTGRITNWKQLGGNDTKIVLLSREVNSGTHVYFKEHVLRNNDPGSKEEFASGALMLSSSQAIADEVAANTAAIGYYGMGYVSSKQKAIAVAGDDKSAYVQPTIENVMDGLYPISRPLFFCTTAQQNDITRKFIDFVLSTEGQQIVRETDFVPIK